MPAIGMPGPLEWLIILAFLTALLAGLLLLIRASRAGGGTRPRGFDVGPTPIRREEHVDDAERR